jgi:hypothetical protein
MVNVGTFNLDETLGMVNLAYWDGEVAYRSHR